MDLQSIKHPRHLQSPFFGYVKRLEIRKGCGSKQHPTQLAVAIFWLCKTVLFYYVGKELISQ